ncbi:MAG: amidohydrolase family protein [Armatimonadota bacterium]|nr:amidohydrolase family protein [Armatimonadota bacterium]MDR7426111.1 amidohydrolase family protein [Armatimonadota bacterium]MDR7463533.1 amidohydrolase family protein [Armatimonadota bacterium]MDR7469110.1 amidohydrolase family protein [Armatimonadota bacterium]MDR7475362.1 amidohydrolase family protein [Armatimonadota bacterium]
MTDAPAGTGTPPGDIIDAHLHLTTEGMIRRMMERPPAIREEARRRSRVRGMTLEERLQPVAGVTLEQHAAAWLAAFDQAGVAGGVFIAVGEANEEMARFVALNPRRLHGVGSLADPRHPDAARTVRTFRARGLCALKLYPPIQRFLANDRMLYPIYEACAEQELPVIFHFGITVGAFYDLSYASPLPLSAVVREFPEVTFIIAHFGAGFFRETLFLAYHTDNVCVDTSGTNNWRHYSPGEPSLEQVFRDTLRAFGPERVLFGTDSTVWGGYRHHILHEQVEVLDGLGVTAADRARILGDNARRVFHL